MALIYFAGNNLSNAMRVCSQEDLQFGEEFGAPVAPAGKSLRHCYFYSIDRLSDDPLQRARQELELVEYAEKTGFYDRKNGRDFK
jgi:hypothetical protein